VNILELCGVLLFADNTRGGIALRVAMLNTRTHKTTDLFKCISVPSGGQDHVPIFVIKIIPIKPNYNTILRC
jgi:hypothetical protein